MSSNRLCSHKRSRRKVSAAATSEKVKRGRVPSAPQTAAPEDGSGRLADLPLAPVLPAPQLEIPDPDDDDEEPAFELPDEDIRSRGGYTPFEQLQFSDEDVTHELTVHVDAPRSKCFQIWSDRANYLEWFDNIYQVRSQLPSCPQHHLPDCLVHIVYLSYFCASTSAYLSFSILVIASALPLHECPFAVCLGRAVTATHVNALKMDPKKAVQPKSSTYGCIACICHTVCFVLPACRI